MRGLPLIFSFTAGQDFIPGSFVPGALNVPSGSFDAPADGPDPLNFDPNEDLANSLVEANEIPEWVDTSDWAEKPLKGTKEHPLRAIAGAHSQIRRANQGNDMRMALVNTEAFVEGFFNKIKEEQAVNPFGGVRTAEEENLAIERSFNLTQIARSALVADCGGRISSLDGSCNDARGRGKVLDSYSRMSPANYCNGRDTSRCKRNGKPLPNARLVSLNMQKRTTPKIPFSKDRTRLLADWGQFITHDMIQTPDMAGGGPDPCNCVREDVCDNIATPKDPVIDFHCFFVVKSIGKIGRTGPNRVATKEQVNQLSGFMDGTQIYGFTNEHLDTLRKDADGNMNHLLFLPDNGPDRGTRLPNLSDEQFKTDAQIQHSFRTEPFLNEKGLPSPVAGDTRCAENVMLTSFHTVFARMHNVIAEGLKKVMDTEDMDHVFFESRQIVIALLNHITFNEFLPAVIGEANVAKFIQLRLQNGDDQLPGKLNARSAFVDFDDYAESDADEEFDPELEFLGEGAARAEQAGSHFRPSSKEPSIRNEFAAALFRWGHSMQPNLLQSRNKFFQPTENRLLRANWFDPQMLARQSPARMLRGGMMIPGVDPGPKWIDDTVHFFFQPAGAKSGIDLMSINIQRGRDHGINSFTEVRKACMQQGRFRSLYRGAKMKTGWGNIVKIYGDVQEVDLYVGMLMEEPVPGSKLGPTSICATVDQFVALKNGDKHWYENADMFSKTQLAAIKKMSLSHVFCQTLTDEDFTVTHNFPMVALGRQFKGKMNRRAACSQMESFDFSAWQDFKPKPTSAPTVMNAPPVTDGLIEFDDQPPQAQSSSELKSLAANKSLCPKMFDQWTVDRNTVGVKCEQRTQLNTFCRAFCLDKSHVFVPGSIQTAQCRGRHIRFAVMPKGHKPFARCGDPEQVQSAVASESELSVGKCGDIRDQKWKMTIGDNVSMNCDGSRCFPGCKDPNKSPTTPVLECVKRGRRSTMTPFFANTQCVDNAPRTVLSNCGDLTDPINPSLVNQIDHDTVRVECFDDFCRLSCKHRLFGFLPGSHDFKSVILQCRNRKVHPFRVQASCAPGMKTAFGTEDVPAEVALKQVTKCETTVFEQFDVPEAAVAVNCTSKKCNVKCKNGNVPTFIWPDGKKVPKSTFICKGRSNWVPRAGQITCP